MTKIPTWGWVLGIGALAYYLYTQNSSAGNGASVEGSGAPPPSGSNADMGGNDFGQSISGGWDS
jgi:hypothetical protein